MAGRRFPVLSDYEILAELGRGSLGTTYKALGRRSREIHALKMIEAPSEDLRIKLKRDVRVLGRLDHPGLAKVHDLVEEGPYLYLTSEFVDGRDLLSALEPPVDLDPERLKRAVFAFGQLLKALGYLHGESLVHRGLKPANVLITREGKLKLLDCGLSHPWSLAAIECLPPELSVAAAYHAPEQLAGRPADARLDLYQTGLLLYEALSGRRPQSGPTLLSVLRARVQDNPAPLHTRDPRVARSFAPLLDRLLARSPEARFGSAAAATAELREAWSTLSRGDEAPAPAASDETLYLRSAPEVAAAAAAATAAAAAKTADEPVIDHTNPMNRIPDFARAAAPTVSSSQRAEPTTARIPVPPSLAAASGARGEAPIAERNVAAALARPPGESAPTLAAALVGRSGDVARLERALGAALSGHGQMVAIAGEAGIGKSRLVDELAAIARLEGALVLAGRSDERRRARRGTVVALIEEAARALAELPEDERHKILPKEASVLAELSDGFRSLTAPGEASGDLEFDADRRKFRLRSAIAELVRNLARRAPLVVILEDLHAADAETIELVDHIARNLLGKPPGERARLLLLITYRPDEVGPDHPLSRALAGLLDESLVDPLDLDRLDSAGTARLVESMTALPSAPEALVRYLQRETEGNPLYVVETVQLLREEGVLAPKEGRLAFDPGRLAELDRRAAAGERRTLPSGIREVVKRRLTRLSAAALEALQLGAVAGSEFDFGLVRHASGRSEEEVLDALVELLHARILIEPPERLASFRFDHDKTREVVLGEIKPRARRSLAAHIASAFEARWGERRIDHAVELVQLFEEALDPEKLVEYLPAAAAAAARDGDLEGALARLERLRELTGNGGDIATELNARKLEARLLVMLGRLDAASARYEELRQRAVAARRDAEEVEARNGLSEVAWRSGDFARARREAEAAMERARARGLKAAEAAALENLGVIFRRTYDVKAASQHLREALKLKRALGDELGAARVLSSLGILFRNQDNYPLASTHFREAHEVYQRRRDRLGIALTLSHLASVHTRSNQFDRAVELYLEAQAIEEAMGNRRGVALCSQGLGTVYLTEGDYAKARTCFEAALEAFRRIGDRHNAAYALINLGHTWFRSGGVPAAITAYQEAVALLEVIGNKVIESEARSGLALALEAAGDKPRAAAEALAAVHIAHERGAREKEAWARHTLSRVNGSREDAELALQLAESVHNENLMFMVHHQLAVLHLERGEREPAREHFQRAFTLIDQLAERTGKAKDMFLRKPPVEAVFRDARRL